MASLLFYGACLHGPLIPWIRRPGSDLFAIGALFVVVVRLAWLLRPGIWPSAVLAVLVAAAEAWVWRHDHERTPLSLTSEAW